MKTTFLFFLTLCCQAFAAMYYVDYQSGSDSNNGTSTNTPFKRVPGMSTATGNAAAVILAQGDVVVFKGGVVHDIDATIQTKTGVTYDGGAWGNQPAILDGNNRLINAISIPAASKNTVIKRLTIQNFGGYKDNDPIWDGIQISQVDTATETFTTTAAHNLVIGDDLLWTSTGTYPAPVTGGVGTEKYFYVVAIPSPTTFRVSTTKGGSVLDITGTGSGTIKAWEPINPSPNVIGISAGSGGANGSLIEDVTIAKVGQWQGKPPMRGVNSVSGMGIALQNNENITIRRCDISKTANAISIKATTKISGILIDDCNLHTNLKWGIDVAPRRAGATLENIAIKKTDIYDYHQFDSGNWQGFGEKPHTDGIFLRTSGMASTWNNIWIDSCRFWQDENRGGKGGTADIYISEGPSALITNCIFYRPEHSRVIGIGHRNPSGMAKQIVRIYNNAFLGGPSQILQAEEPDKEKRFIDVRNNIFVRQGADISIMVNQNSGIMFSVLNNNLYYNPNITEDKQNVAFLNSHGGYVKFARLKMLGYESFGKYGDPGWPVKTGNFSQINWNIPANSPAVGMGANLTEFFTTDGNGNPRPSIGAWDAGPYVFNVSPPIPPTDIVPPELRCTNIVSTGDKIILCFNEFVQGLDASHFEINGYTVSNAQGVGPNWTLDISPAVSPSAVLTMSYTGGAGRVEDIAGNLLPSGTFNLVNGAIP